MTDGVPPNAKVEDDAAGAEPKPTPKGLGPDGVEPAPKGPAPKLEDATTGAWDKDPEVPKLIGPEVEAPKLNFGMEACSPAFAGAEICSVEFIISIPLLAAGWLPKVKVAMGEGCDKDPALAKFAGPELEVPKLNFGMDVSSAALVGAES